MRSPYGRRLRFLRPQRQRRVAPLVAAIEAQGWSVWWDPDIATGQDFDRQIATELKLAKSVLVVWTPKSVESRWVRGEAREAAERGILVPVRFEQASLPIDVRTFHTTDLDGVAGDAQQSAAAGSAARAGGDDRRQRRARPTRRAGDRSRDLQARPRMRGFRSACCRSST
jgi:adenylate cyclase